MLRVCCFIVVFILCACNNRTRGETPLTVNNDLYVVDIDHADRENIVYSAVFGKLKTVVLGANDSVLIGEIRTLSFAPKTTVFNFPNTGEYTMFSLSA